MQDRYIGDVGDFGKYLLLNDIYNISKGSIRLGINWFYVSGKNEGETEGGKPVTTVTPVFNYLSDKNKYSNKYCTCFPELYRQLKNIVDNDRRNIKEIENNSVLPIGTVFYSKPLPLPYLLGARENWLDESLTNLKNTDIIFLDPDNGIQTEKVKKTQSKANKYVFKDEIKQYYDSDKSLIIYNHKDHKPRDEYNTKISGIRNYLNILNDIQVIRFKRVSVRDFIFLIQKDHHSLIEKTITHLTGKPYDFLFSRYQ
jgi:hypothetical protein